MAIENRELLDAIKAQSAEVDALAQDLQTKRTALYEVIRKAVWAGSTIAQVAEVSNKTPQRIHQIIEASRRPKRRYVRSKRRK